MEHTAIIEPKKYKPNNKTSDKKYIKNGFTRRNNGYVLTKYLYKNIIKMVLYISPDENYLNTEMLHNDHLFAPFYNPDDRHDNLVYDEVVKKYNKYMDKLARKGLIKYEKKYC